VCKLSFIELTLLIGVLSGFLYKLLEKLFSVEKGIYDGK